MLTLRRHAQVSAVLAAPEFQVLGAAPGEPGLAWLGMLTLRRHAVPAAPQPEAVGALAWLRGTVSRFSTGEPHERRRALGTAALPDPAGLRAAAGAAAAAALGGAFPTDGGTTLARRIPVEVLATALGFAGPVADAVAAVAALYLTGPDGADPAVVAAADAAVADLVASSDASEGTAARIAVLVQAHDATAGLVTAALRELARHRPSATVPGVLVETLRYAPPVPVQRRTCVRATLVGTVPVAAGTPVVLDIAAANRDPDVFADPDRFDPGRADAHRHLTFGSGLRPCPGDRQALALAAGVVDALLETLCARQVAEPLWVATAAALLTAREEQ